MGRSPHLSPQPAPDLRRGRRGVARRRGLRDHDARRPGLDHQRALRQPAALHLPRLLPAGLQGQRQGQSADHPPAGRDRARSRGPGRLDGGARRDRRVQRALHRGSPTSQDGREQFQPADTVAVCGYAIETPRLLLHSTSRRFPHGLGNQSDQLGRYVMVQGATQVAARFPMDLRMYKAPPPRSPASSSTRPTSRAGFARGFSIQTVSPLPIGWAEHVQADGHWGAGLREYMRDYNHWTVLGVLCELLPQPENRVTLADEKDRYGMPVAEFSHSLCDNDKRNIAFATRTMEGSGSTPGRRTRSRSTATRIWSEARGWAGAPRTASSTRAIASGACRTCSSSTAASFPPRAPPTRPWSSWPSPTGAPVCWHKSARMRLER